MGDQTANIFGTVYILDQISCGLIIILLCTKARINPSLFSAALHWQDAKGISFLHT